MDSGLPEGFRSMLEDAGVTIHEAGPVPGGGNSSHPGDGAIARPLTMRTEA